MCRPYAPNKRCACNAPKPAHACHHIYHITHIHHTKHVHINNSRQPLEGHRGPRRRQAGALGLWLGRRGARRRPRGDGVGDDPLGQPRLGRCAPLPAAARFSLWLVSACCRPEQAALVLHRPRSAHTSLRTSPQQHTTKRAQNHKQRNAPPANTQTKQRSSTTSSPWTSCRPAPTAASSCP